VTADRALARYVRRTVYPYAAHYRGALDRAGLGAAGVTTRSDLARLPPIDLATVDDPGSLVLRPDMRTILREGDRFLAARVILARLIGTFDRFNATVFEPTFKPVHWLASGKIPIGSTTSDLVRLGRLGATLLERAGVGPDDVLVSVLPGDGTLAHLEFVHGARRRRVPAAHLGQGATAADVVALGPTVLAGHAEQLRTILAEFRLPLLRTVLCVGEEAAPSLAQLRVLAELAGTSPVVASWAAPGARALWGECRPHASVTPRQDVVLHLNGESEVVETLDGELLWTGVGWHGSALLRVRTDSGGSLLDACPACGSVEPVVRPADSVRLAFVAADPDVESVELEQRTVDGSPELIVHLRLADGADPATVVRRLDQRLQATQYVLRA